MPDKLDPAGIVGEYTELLPPGSHLALSHYLDPSGDPGANRLARELEHRFVHGLGSGWFRTREQIASYFGGLELIDPAWSSWATGGLAVPRCAHDRWRGG
ncbi:SAM-dependent methyltransferase [Nocardia gipuzkoensis]|uniref:SAM-dependent methyltransferase n=1 Tax=Nocardia gipuzkoensis TaxID=2749991 RepID=UPI001E5329AD|nr:SAM-dependent methyltransferase [Nocardia gipuzkoensis]UGT71112.1 SAM-dependent methyltransferase [Nocardia gipuzkoensis]